MTYIILYYIILYYIILYYIILYYIILYYIILYYIILYIQHNLDVSLEKRSKLSLCIGKISLNAGKFPLYNGLTCV